MCRVILKPSTLQELFRIYKEDHPLVNNENELLLRNMKFGLWRVVKIRMESVIDMLLEKDREEKKK